MLYIFNKIPALITLALTFFIIYPSQAQSNQLLDLVQPYIYPLTLEDGELSGPGLDWIKENGKSCDFLTFGEGHGILQVPQIIGNIYQQLYQDGFHYLAVENGPYVGKIVSEQTL
ncbi:MAG: hypothetical protein AAF705_12560, partial [Bacteroidota bacterium]